MALPDVNMDVPLLDRSFAAAVVRRANLKSVICHQCLWRFDLRPMLQLIGEKSFAAFARCTQNGFAGLTVCFMTVSRQRPRQGSDRCRGKRRQGAKRPFDSSMTSHA
ncbi:hypothetical protein ACQR16_20050 [Bradyrhizobium oligotrophicum]|uniref:hypothetical protein n=1 Tax=Bradyrhizobium oligotrophicum TaxID=44255 RepID=UPI003EBA30A8